MAVIKDIDESQAPLLDHLIELRGRLVRCVLALALAFGLCLYFADPILGFEGTAGGMEIQALPTANEYLGLVMQFILAFGMSFLLPVLLLLLHRAGLVTRDQLVSARRYVIVLIVALAAIITPPDPGSQLLLAVPLLLLFEGSLVLMRLTDRRRLTDSDGADEAQSAS